MIYRARVLAAGMVCVMQMSTAKQPVLRELFSELQDEIEASFHNVAHALPGSKSPTYTVNETNEASIIEIAAPGLAKELFDIVFEHTPYGATVSVSAEVKTEESTTDEEKKQHHKSVSQQTFTLRIRVDHPVVAESVTAEYKDGILTITLPKAAPAKKHVHTVKVK